MRSTSRLHLLAGAALIGLCTFVAYYPCLRGGFILDDNVLLTDNPLIKASDGLYRIWFTTEAPDYWPVSNTTLWFEWRLWAMNSTGYHLTNLCLHLVEALLLWASLRALSIPGAFLAALLFAVHPVNVETVAWIAQRKTLLAMLFCLLSLLCYLKAEARSTRPSRIPRSGRDRRGGRAAAIAERLNAERHPTPGAARWYWLSVAAFTLAMLSKVSVATFPVLLLIILWWMRPLTWRDLSRVAPLVVITGASIAVNGACQ